MNNDSIKIIGSKLNNLRLVTDEFNRAVESIKNNDFALGNYLKNIKNLSLQMKDLCISCDRQLMFLANEFRSFDIRQKNIADKRKYDLEQLKRREKREVKT